MSSIRPTLSRALRRMVERPLYTLGIRAYAGAVGAASLRHEKARLMTRGHRHTWEKLATLRGEPTVWIHAASLGEFEQGRPLIERIKAKWPGRKVLLSFFSPSGYEVRKNYAGADCVVYLPFDTPANARRFIEMANPETAIFVKYEFWRNYLEALHSRNIPAYLISAVFRPDQKFFKKATSWYSGWLRWFRHIYVQDDRSRRLLESVGIKDVTVAGDTRFDRVADIRAARKAIPELERFKASAEPGWPLLMAGSSWETDERIYLPWLNAHPQVKTVIAPHEFDSRRLERLRSQCANGCVLLSEMKADPGKAEGCQVLVIDCFGLLSSAYAYCDLAYVGGGFGAGLHNINEAAVYGVPVIYGPNNSKFIEAQDLAALGGGMPVESREGFERVADRLVYDCAEREKRGRWAGEYISEKTGASDLIFSDLFLKD